MSKRRATGIDREILAFGTPDKSVAPSFVVRFYATGGFDVDLSMQVGPTREFSGLNELRKFIDSLTKTARVAAHITDKHGRYVHYDDLQKLP